MKTWVGSLVIALALLASACAPINRVTPEPARPITATPLPRSDHPIYIVDPHNGDLVSRIIIVDPETARVVGGFAARYTPEIAISPDGKRLYLADSYSTQVIRGDHHDVVSMYDLVSGNLLRDDVEIPNRLLYKVYPTGQPFMFLSRDGKRIFIGKYGAPDIHAMRMTVLDAETFKTLGEYAYPACTQILSLEDGRLACIAQAKIEIRDALTGVLMATISLPITSAVLAELAASGERLYIVSSDARVVVINIVTLRVDGDPIRIDLSRDSQVGGNHHALARDESRMYVGVMSGDNRYQGLANEIWVLDTRTWMRVGIISPADPAFHIAVSADGSQLYTINPFKKSMDIFDTKTFSQTGLIHDLGETPARVVVPAIQ